MKHGTPVFSTRLGKRIVYAYRRHGTFGFCRLVFFNMLHYLRHGNREKSGTDPFDLKYGTETGQVREIGSLDVLSLANATQAQRYQTSNELAIRATIERLGVDFGRFTFIDFGSGKGKVLLVAAGFPFKAVFGIEFSRELHEAAMRNIALFPKEQVRAGSVDSICSDATAVELPESDLVCYFYNPFGPSVLAQIAAQLRSHIRSGRYRVFVIYVDARHREVFQATGEFSVHSEQYDTLILTSSAGTER